MPVVVCCQASFSLPKMAKKKISQVTVVNSADALFALWLKLALVQQETFDAAVKGNIEDFEMSVSVVDGCEAGSGACRCSLVLCVQPDEAIRSAIEEFTLQVLR